MVSVLKNGKDHILEPLIWNHLMLMVFGDYKSKFRPAKIANAAYPITQFWWDKIMNPELWQLLIIYLIVIAADPFQEKWLFTMCLWILARLQCGTQLRNDSKNLIQLIKRVDKLVSKIYKGSSKANKIWAFEDLTHILLMMKSLFRCNQENALLCGEKLLAENVNNSQNKKEDNNKVDNEVVSSCFLIFFCDWVFISFLLKFPVIN